MDIPQDGLIIDAVFGTGLTREITGDAGNFVPSSNTLLVRLSRLTCRLDCMPIQAIASLAPQADLHSYFFVKMGHILMPGKIMR